jgi:hypothetical protein
MTAALAFIWRLYSFRRWIFFALISLLGWWLVTPRGGEVRAESCEPDGPIASLSAFLYGDDFWKAQLPFVRKTAERAEGWKHFRSDFREQESQAIESANQKLEALYEIYPDLAPTRADRLRKVADKLDEQAADEVSDLVFQRQAEGARRCEVKILKLM